MSESEASGPFPAGVGLSTETGFNQWGLSGKENPIVFGKGQLRAIGITFGSTA
jgi:hypothetical protein